MADGAVRTNSTGALTRAGHAPAAFTAYTVMAWVKEHTAVTGFAGTLGYIGAVRAAAAGFGHALVLDANGALGTAFAGITDGTTTIQGWTLVASEWRFICAVVSGAGSNNATLSWSAANDTSGALSTATGTLSTANTPDELNIAIQRGDGFGLFGDMSVSHFRVWDVALSAGEILAERASATLVKTANNLAAVETQTAAGATTDSSPSPFAFTVLGSGLTDNASGPLAAPPPSASGIVYQSAAASATSGTTTVSPAYPSSIAAGDLLIMLVGQKPTTANGGTVTTPSGWALVTSLTGANDGNTGGYTTTTGADVGNVNIYAYSKTASGSESGTLAVTVGDNNVVWALIMRLSNGTKLWSVAGTTGKRTSTPTSPISVTFAANPGVRKGDYVVAAFAIPTDVTTPAQFSSETLSQTGVTFGTVSEVEEPDTATGLDIGGVVVRAAVTAGAASAAPVFGSTMGGTLTNVRGPLVFLRIRERLVGLQNKQLSLRNPQLCM